MSYFYNIGDVISDEKGSIKILNRFKDDSDKKKYEYQCLKCGYIGKNFENKIRHRKVRCSVCCKNSKLLIKGVNTLGDTFPWIIDYLDDEKDADKYLAGSNKRIKFKCPICKNVSSKVIYKVVQNGFSCSVCSSKISYPNKLLYEILKSIDIDFETEKVFDWSDKKQYDFYIPSIKCIVEMNGCQHYQDGFNKPLGYTKSNDLYKEQLARHSGEIDHYLIVDCKESDCDYIYNNLCKEPVLVSLGILNIDISVINKKIREFNSVYQCVADMWKADKTTTEIANELKISTVSVVKYLKEATKIGLVNYNPKSNKNIKTKKVIVDLETMIEYESISQCAKSINKTRTFVKYHKERFKEKDNND